MTGDYDRAGTPLGQAIAEAENDDGLTSLEQARSLALWVDAINGGLFMLGQEMEDAGFQSVHLPNVVMAVGRLTEAAALVLKPMLDVPEAEHALAQACGDFRGWLVDWKTRGWEEDDDNDEGPTADPDMLAALAGCTLPLAHVYAAWLDLPEGTTYAQAAESVAGWSR